MKQRVGQVNLIVKEVSFSADQNGSLESVSRLSLI